MKNKMKIYMIIMIIMMMTSITVSAASFINSKEVIYDNSISGMESTNVQSAVDELYSAATDYTSVAAKLTQLESKLEDKSKWHLISNNLVELKGGDQDLGTFDLSNYNELYIDFVYVSLTESGVVLPLIDSVNTFSSDYHFFAEGFDGSVNFYAYPSSDKKNVRIRAYVFKLSFEGIIVRGIYAR